jgi:hypothetical protein
MQLISNLTGFLKIDPPYKIEHMALNKDLTSV